MDESRRFATAIKFRYEKKTENHESELEADY